MMRRKSLLTELRAKGFVVNLSSQLAANFFSLAVSIFTIPYAARTLGTRGFGEYNLMVSFANYAILASSFGFSSLATRELPRQEQIQSTVSFTFTLRLILSIASAVGLWFFTRLTLGESAAMVPLAVVLGINVIMLSADLRWVFICREQIWQAAYMGVAGQIMFCIFLVLFVHTQDDVVVYALVQLLILFVPVVISNVQYARQFGRLRFSFKPGLPGNWIVESLPLGLSALTATINSSFAGIVVGLYLSTTDLGEFAAGYKLIMVMNGLFVVLASVVVPRISRLYSKDRSALIRFLRIYFLLCLGTGVLGGGCIFVGAGPLVKILFGPDFHRTQLLIEVWSLTFVPLNAAEVFVLSCLVPCNASRAYLVSLLAGASMLLLGVPAFARLFSLVGIPIAQSLSEAVMVIVGTMAMVKQLKLSKPEILSFLNVRSTYRAMLE